MDNLVTSNIAYYAAIKDIKSADIDKEELKPYKINKGDTLIFVSVGAGMNINALIYKM